MVAASLHCMSSIVYDNPVTANLLASRTLGNKHMTAWVGRCSDLVKNHFLCTISVFGTVNHILIILLLLLLFFCCFFFFCSCCVFVCVVEYQGEPLVCALLKILSNSRDNNIKMAAAKW